MIGPPQLASLVGIAFAISALDGSTVIEVTPGGPVTTLEAAREARREIDGPATIRIAEGTYYLAETLHLGRQDSDTTWQAAEGATVLVRGSALIPATDKASLSVEFGTGRRVYALFQGDRRLTLAREPDVADGYARVPGQPVPFWQEREDDSRSEFSLGLPASSAPSGDLERAEANVYPRYNYWNEVIPIRSLEGGLVTLDWEASFAIRPGDRYFLQNSAAFLDRPGEWFYHPDTGEFRILPLPTAAPIYVVVLADLIHITGARAITFENLSFQHAGESAIRAEDSAGITLVGNTVRHLGGARETAAFNITGSGGSARRNTIEDVGGHGILATGDRFIAEDNAIRRFGIDFKQGAGIRIDGSDHRAAHNLIEFGPRWGIGFHGRGHIIELNRIHGVSLETADTAAIYGGAHGDPRNGHHLIRYNVITDVPGLALDPASGEYIATSASGIYLDDGMSDCTVTGNLVARASLGGGFNHGGVRNTWSGNIFIGGTDRQMTFDQWDDLPGSNRFHSNIVTYSTPGSVYLKLSENAPLDSDHNIVHAPDGAPQIRIGEQQSIGWAEWQARGHDQASILADPQIGDDFRLAPTSPALRSGFDPVPTHAAGPRP
ncbi:hypothetical protein BH23VER1_BH23VER1_16800 [soil metagenome]